MKGAGAKISVITALGIWCLMLWGFSLNQTPDITAGTPLMELMKQLGYISPEHYRANPDSIKVRQGHDLITKGFTYTENGKKTKVISIYFKCTNCHNTILEDPILHDPTAERRLEYAVQNKLPFLPGTTFYGIVNRETWYNDDYQEKYGDFAKKAYHSLPQAIQLCATECSKGRWLEQWEMEAILSYFSTIGLKVKDLGFAEHEMPKLQGLLALMPNDAAVVYLKKLFPLKSPAHFLSEDEARKNQESLIGNASNGHYIYELGCKHCHGKEGVTHLLLDDQEVTFQFLKNHLDRRSTKSIFHAVREGVSPTWGYPPYMPQYSKERMSPQQLADLIAYILKKAEDK